MPRPRSSLGSESSSARVYGMRGAWKTSSTGPASTILPAYITIVRCAISATTPKLCVMNKMPSRFLPAPA